MDTKTETETLTPRQEQILDCTTTLLREEGMAGLTVRKVAARVGFSEAALYRHYSSKDALLVGLLERLEGKLLAGLGVLAADCRRSVEERIEDCLRFHVAMVLEADGLPVLVLTEGASHGGLLAQQVRHLLRGYFKIMESLVEQLPHATGAEFSVRERVMMLMGLPAIAAVLCRALPSNLPRARLKNEMVHDWVNRLIGAQPAENVDV